MAADVNTVDATHAGSDSCLDSRGIRRGKCTDEKCPCNKYDGGEDKKRCVSCKHPPGKHSNLDKTDSNGHKLAECAADDCKEPVFTDHYGTFKYCSPECRDKDLSIHQEQLDIHITDMESELRHLTPISIPLSHQSDRKGQKCVADGCKEYVYTKYRGVSFKYCSPECRDKNLLGVHHDQLNTDIEDMELALRQLSPISIALHHQSDNSGERHEESLRRSRAAREESKSPSPGHSEKHNRATSKESSKGGKNKRKKQKNSYKEVVLKKDADGSYGIIVSNQFWKEEDQVNSGLLVTGVKIPSKALQHLQDCKIQFCDVIVKVNGKPVTEEMCMSVQDKLYDILSGWDGDSVQLSLYRSGYYYPDISAKALSLLLKVLTETPSHVIDVIHPRNLYMDHLESGMDITNTNILNITEMSPSYTCGMRDKDEFLGSVIPQPLNKQSQSLITCKQHDRIKDRISNASGDIILAIRRK